MNRRTLWLSALVLGAAHPTPAVAEDGAAVHIDVVDLFHAGGVIGYIITVLSVAMVALIVEHLLTIRRGTLMPSGLAEQIHALLAQGQFKQAEEVCRARPSFLAHVLEAGLAEVSLGYSAVEKAMEDAATEQAARLFRKVSVLSIIGGIAPMLGLLGTVWGMILAFMEFEVKANPQVSELAPGVYRALVTTLQGLVVAIPALGAHALFQNRIDELVAQTSLLAEHVFADWKRSLAAKRRAERQNHAGTSSPRPAAPSVRREPTA